MERLILKFDGSFLFTLKAVSGHSEQYYFYVCIHQH